MRHLRLAESPAWINNTDIRVAIDGQVGDVAQRLGCTIKVLPDLEQFRVVINKCHGGFAGCKCRVVQDILQEADVGLDATDTKLTQGPVTPRYRTVQCPSPGCDLYQHRIKKR